MNAKTYLLYSDDRIDLKNEANKLAHKIYEDENILFNEDDVLYYENIKISDVREIIEKTALSSYSGLKIFILNLDKIRIEAVNALLKIIEEPPLDTSFILLSKNLKLPQTILSRSIKLPIKPKKIDVPMKIYNIFDGNEKFLKEFIEKEINIKDYEIEDTMSYLEALKLFFENKDDVYNRLKFELSIDYFIFNMQYKSSKEKLDIINETVILLEKERDLSMYFLERILLRYKMNLDISVYKKIIDLKNSLKANVSVKYCMYLALNILLGGLDV